MKVVIIANQSSKHGILTPMLEINEKPILYYVLTHFLKEGYDDIILTVPRKNSSVLEYLKKLTIYEKLYIVEENNPYFEKEEKRARVLVLERNDDEKTSKTLDFISKYIGENAFIFTYGDVLPTIDVEKTLQFHRESSKIATICAYQPYGSEKWINLGVMILENEALDYIKENDESFEKNALRRIAEDDELSIFKENSVAISK